MRKIYFDLTKDDHVSRYGFGGLEGEHNATELSVKLPERMKEHTGAEYRFLFETAKGEVIFSMPVLPDEEGLVSVLLTRALMMPPTLKAYVGCYLVKDSEAILVAKTGEMVLGVHSSPEEETASWDPSGGGVPGLVVDSELNKTSSNPIENKAVALALEKKIGESELNEAARELTELVETKLSKTDYVVDENLSPFSENPIQNKKVHEALGYRIPRTEFETAVSKIREDLEQKMNRSDYVVEEVLDPESENPVQSKTLDILFAILAQEIQSVSNSVGKKLGAENVDKTLDENSENPIQNKAVAEAVGKKVDQEAVEDFFSAESENPVQNRLLSSSVSNALKTVFSQSAATLKNISPLPHELSLRVEAPPSVGDLIEPVSLSFTDLTESGFYTVLKIENTEENETQILFTNGKKWSSSADLSTSVSVNDVLFYDADFVSESGETGALFKTVPFDPTTLHVSAYESQNYTSVSENTWNGSWTFVANQTLKAGKTYHFIADVDSTTESTYIAVYQMTNGSTHKWLKGENSVCTFTVGAKDCDRFYIHATPTYDATASHTASIKRFVVVEAKTPEVRNPEADGSVRGMICRGKDLVLVSDRADCVLSGEYNQDVNRVVKDLEQRLIRLESAAAQISDGGAA